MNMTDSSSQTESFEEILPKVIDGICYFVIVVTALFNLGSILTVAAFSKLFKSPKFIIVTQLSMVLLVFGLFVLAGQLKNIRVLNCSLHYYTVLFNHLCLSSMISFCVLLNIDYMMMVVSPVIYKGGKKYALVVFLIFLVYVINSLLIVPLFVNTFELHESPKRCSLKVTNTMNVKILLLLTLVPQTVFVLITFVLSIFIYLGYRKSKLDITPPIELLFTDTVVLLLANIPIALALFANFRSLLAATLIWLIPFLLPVILPLVWLMDKDYRQTIREVITCRCRKSRNSESYEMM